MFKNTVFLVLCLAILNVNAQDSLTFKVLPLGTKGGLVENNLSAYLVAPVQEDSYICLDAGTLRSGIDKAIDKNNIKIDATQFLRKNIKVYLISHAHLDHVSGLILNSPTDSTKNIYALPSVLSVFKEKYFTWSAWANFANEGEKPVLNKYIYKPLILNELQTIENTKFKVRTYPLSHGKSYESAAFLVEMQEKYLLYLGDTGADSIESSTKLAELWKSIAPLIDNHSLKAIFLEVSFANKQPDDQLFGHLKPSLLIAELTHLKQLTKSKDLSQLKIIITHIKPTENSEEIIANELKSNNLGINFIYPTQGEFLYF